MLHSLAPAVRREGGIVSTFEPVESTYRAQATADHYRPRRAVSNTLIEEVAALGLPAISRLSGGELLAVSYSSAASDQIDIPIEENVEVGNPSAADELVILIVSIIRGPSCIARDRHRSTDLSEI